MSRNSKTGSVDFVVDGVRDQLESEGDWELVNQSVNGETSLTLRFNSVSPCVLLEGAVPTLQHLGLAVDFLDRENEHSSWQFALVGIEYQSSPRDKFLQSDSPHYAHSETYPGYTEAKCKFKELASEPSKRRDEIQYRIDRKLNHLKRKKHNTTNTDEWNGLETDSLMYEALADEL